jgi:DNA repair protein RecO (recombination protein O)
VFVRKSSSSLDILTESQLIARFQPSPKSLTSLYGGYYLAELLSGLTEEYDPHPRLYEVAVETLRRLETDADARPILTRFELVLLRELGQLPEFEACLVCGRPVAPPRTYAYWIAQGGLICEACQRPEYKKEPIEAATITLLKQLSDDAPDAVTTTVPSPEHLTQLRQITTAAVSHVLERRPSTLRYLHFD